MTSRPLLHEAERLPSPRLVAQIAGLAGEATGRLRRDEAARQYFDMAARAAAGEHDDYLIADMRIAQASIALQRGNTRETALVLLEVASSSVERAGNPPELAARLTQLRGVAAGTNGDHAAAAGSTRPCGSAAPMAAPTISRRATCCLISVTRVALGQAAPASAACAQALEVLTHNLGDQHPDTVTTLEAQAALAGDAGQVQRQLALLEQIDAILVRSLGPTHPRVARNQAQRCAAFASAQTTTAPSPHLLCPRRRAGTAKRGAAFPSSWPCPCSTLATCSSISATMPQRRSRSSRRSIVVARRGPAHVELAGIYSSLADAEAGLGNLPQALAWVETAQHVVLAQPTPSAELIAGLNEQAAQLAARGCASAWRGAATTALTAALAATLGQAASNHGPLAPLASGERPFRCRANSPAC